MADSAALSTFPPALAKLLLCGGGGLLAAWGPLKQGPSVAPWDPTTQRAARAFVHDAIGGAEVLTNPSSWSLPLESSPWPARMAVVAAWMLLPRHRYLAAHVEADPALLTLTRVRFTSHARGLAMGDWTWNRNDGRSENAEVHLPTLPTHLAQHPPEVALLLALYDVPEIKARVEALHG